MRNKEEKSMKRRRRRRMKILIFEEGEWNVFHGW
jgi:hypothetical protein